MARGTILAVTLKDGTKRYKTIIRINGKQQWRTWYKKRDAENYLDDLSPEVILHVDDVEGVGERFQYRK